MTDLSAIVGQNVRTARLAIGLSQRELSARAEISMRHLRDIEHGRANARLQVLERLALVLATTPASLAMREPDNA